MPATPEGVYADKGGQWYFKVTLGRDPLTGRREQVTRRGFRTETEAAKARRELLERKDRGRVGIAESACGMVTPTGVVLRRCCQPRCHPRPEVI